LLEKKNLCKTLKKETLMNIEIRKFNLEVSIVKKQEREFKALIEYGNTLKGMINKAKKKQTELSNLLARLSEASMNYPFKYEMLSESETLYPVSESLIRSWNGCCRFASKYIDKYAVKRIFLSFHFHLLISAWNTCHGNEQALLRTEKALKMLVYVWIKWRVGIATDTSFFMNLNVVDKMWAEEKIKKPCEIFEINQLKELENDIGKMDDSLMEMFSDEVCGFALDIRNSGEEIILDEDIRMKERKKPMNLIKIREKRRKRRKRFRDKMKLAKMLEMQKGIDKLEELQECRKKKPPDKENMLLNDGEKKPPDKYMERIGNDEYLIKERRNERKRGKTKEEEKQLVEEEFLEKIVIKRGLENEKMSNKQKKRRTDLIFEKTVMKGKGLSPILVENNSGKVISTDLESKPEEVKLYKSKGIIKKLFNYGIKCWRNTEEVRIEKDVEFLKIVWSFKIKSLNAIQEVTKYHSEEYGYRGSKLMEKIEGLVYVLVFLAMGLEVKRWTTWYNEEYS
jgi:hypothetical protein